jgi:GAF domain-containing protein
MTVPHNESERLRTLRSYEILDTPPDGAFDRITQLAAQIFKTPIALITLVDEDRIWFQSRHGLEEVVEIDREPGLCASVIMSDDAYVIRNALGDPRALANPLVAGAMGLRFYAAAPLITHDGYRLGTINVIDFEPRDFNAEGEAILKQLAAIAMEQMALRLSARKMMSGLLEALQKAQGRSELDEFVTVCAWTKRAKIDGEWLTFDEFLTQKMGLTVSHGIHPDAALTFLEGK